MRVLQTVSCSPGSVSKPRHLPALKLEQKLEQKPLARQACG